MKYYFNMITRMRDSVMAPCRGSIRFSTSRIPYVEHAFYVKYVFRKDGSLAKVEPVPIDYEIANPYEVKVRTRPDFVHKTKLFDLDLKSTQDASPLASFEKCRR